jgi:hypothetical protein
MTERHKTWLAWAAPIAVLTFGIALPSVAGTAEAWDDGHMQSRFGGPRTGPSKPGPIYGWNRFDPPASQAPVSAAVTERLLPASQRPWSQRTTGLSSVPGDGVAGPRPQPRSEMRHNRNPASWSRGTQSSGLRAGAVRRSSGGR